MGENNFKEKKLNPEIVDIIKIGTKVVYRPSFGCGKPTIASVKTIERCEGIGDKYGKVVDKVQFYEKDYCTFDLDDNHWCYGEQIDRIYKRHKVVLTHTTQRESLERGWGLITLTINLSDEEFVALKDCMKNNNSGTMALYNFTHNQICSKHHKYLIWNTFEEGEINIKIVD